jgi:hypothetical protein
VDTQDSGLKIQDSAALPRLQLALNVPDLEQAISFYSDLFQAQPAKVRPGYANYALSTPPLKLVLIENPGASERLNHLGVEVASPAEVVAETRRLGAILPIRLEEGTECCYALQDKVWVSGPDRTDWEVYTVLADSQVFSKRPAGEECVCATDAEAAAACCGGTATEKACC